MELVLLLVAVLLLANLWRRIGILEKDIDYLRDNFEALKNKARQLAPMPTAPPAAGVWPAKPETPAPSPAVEWPAETFGLEWPVATPAPTVEPLKRPAQEPMQPVAQTPEAVRQAYQSKARAEAIRSAMRAEPPEERPAPPAGGDFEFNFGKKLPVWIGGVALAFAGFYLVKYSIEMGLLTKEVRIILGFIFGAGMIGAASYIRLRKPDMADGARIAQALTGAGIADLYATVYAATMMFGMIQPVAGFFFMGIVTAMAVVLSVRHGMPIAILGLLGGFLTPVLIHTGHPYALGLFSYLLMLVVGFFIVITTLAWWVLAIPVLALAFLWVPVWLFVPGYFHPEDGVWLSLFLLAVAGIAIGAAGKAAPAATTGNDSLKVKDDSDSRRDLGRTAMAGCVVLMAVVTGQSDFALIDWGLYAILGAGCMAMAWFRPSLYAIAPWLTMCATLMMLAIWDHVPDSTNAFVLAGFSLLYTGGALFLLRARPSLQSAGLLSAAALAFYGLGYARLHEKLYTLLDIQHDETLHLWGMMALLLGGLFTLLTGILMQKFRGDDTLRQRLLAIAALTATAFMSIALTIEVRHEFLGVAFAAEILAVCWINLKVDIKSLREIAAILFGIFVALMGEQLLMLFALVVNSLFGQTIDFWHNGHLPLATDPMFQLGLPMVLIGASAWLIQRHHDGRLAEIFEMASVGLGALWIYYITRHVFNVPEDALFRKAGFFERGIITNLFFAAGLGVVYGGRLFTRRALVWSGTALFAMAMFRVFWFDVLTQNPLWTTTEVGSTFLFNSLIFPYLLPCFWLWLEERPQLRLVTMSPTLRGGIMLALLFIYITLNVRQSFHGSLLAEGPTTDAEVYAYSAVWLMLGAFLLFFGTARKDKPMRIASLVIMILAVGKVFLYDAAALTGLYRVFSFMGLGLSLLALSWFYTRFVFKE